MRKATTPLDRLALLVPWLNGEPVPRLRLQLAAFLGSFDGAFDGAGQGHVQTYLGQIASRREPPRIERARQLTDETLEDVRLRLVDLLRRGFPHKPGSAATVTPRFRGLNADRAVAKATRTLKEAEVWVTKPKEWAPKAEASSLVVEEFPSLRFGVRGTGRLPLGETRKLVPGTLRERYSEREAMRRYLAPGAYVLVVDGALRDLMPFLVMHLLTASGMATLTRCPAPTPNNWTDRCGRFILTTTGKGRPRVFCSEACRVRRFAERKQIRKRKGRTGWL